MTNLELQTKLKQYPDDMKVVAELDEGDTTIQALEIAVTTTYNLDEILIHNDPTYQQPQ